MSYTEPASQQHSKIPSIRVHNKADFEGMRKAGKVAASCLDMLIDEVKPGVTTRHLDDLAREFVLDNGGIPACLFYRGYRHTICTSINHVICHGIPSSKPLKKGDIVNIDVTVIVDGWHGDTSRMYVAGEAKRKAIRLMDTTYECMMKGIEQVKPGNTLEDIGAAIANHAHAERYGVVEDFCGHGLGRVFHDAPNVLHYAPKPSEKRLRAIDTVILEPGMFFTIEPMINLGSKDVFIKSDGWTAVTRDKSLSAQFEHSIGVTETGVEIFTTSPSGFHTPHAI